MQHQTIAVLDYGSQYSQLICRRVREKQVYAELISWDRADELLPKLKPRGIILSGGPNSVYAPGAPTLPAAMVARWIRTASRAASISARTAVSPSFGSSSSACGVWLARSAHRGNSST